MELHTLGRFFAELVEWIKEDPCPVIFDSNGGLYRDPGALYLYVDGQDGADGGRMYVRAELRSGWLGIVRSGLF